MPFNFVPAVGSPFAVGAQPSGLAWGYLDPDSTLDLVTANMGSDDYSVLKGLGNGTYATAVNYPLKPGFAPSDAAVADCNNDNIPDVLIAGGGTNEFSLSYGVGDGTFLAPIYTVADWFPRSFVVKDFNGDGFNDVFLTTMGGVTALNGTGTGFGAPVTFPSVTNSTSIITGDFFNNGKLGVAVAGPITHEVETFPGTGTGGLGPGVVTSLGSSGTSVPKSIAAADLNGDGNLDLVAAFVSIVILYGYGNGSFWLVTYPVPGTSVKIADADLDGFLDVFIGDSPAKSVYVLPGNSNGTFTSPSFFSIGIGNEPTVYVVDVNNDGLPDFLTLNGPDNTTTVEINKLTPPLSLTPSSTLTQSLTTSNSATPSLSSTISESPSLSTTPSQTMSTSATSTLTPSISPTHTFSQSITPSQTMSATNSYSPTTSPSNLTTISASITSTSSASASLSTTMSESRALISVFNSPSSSRSEIKTNSNKTPTKQLSSPKTATHTPQKTDKAEVPRLHFDTNQEHQVSVFDTTDCRQELGHAVVNMPDTDEYAVSAPGARKEAGTVYVLSDQTEALALFYAEDLPPQNMQIDGANPGDRFGSTLAVGDMNGDGRGDLIVAAEHAYKKRGAVYIVYSPIKKSMNVKDMTSDEGAIFIGEKPGDSLGIALARLRNPFNPSGSYLAISSLRQQIYILRTGHYPIPTKIAALDSNYVLTIQLKNATTEGEFGSSMCAGGDFMGDFSSQNRSSLIVGDRVNSLVRVLELPLNDTQESYYAEDLTLMTIATKNRHDELGKSMTLVEDPVNQFNALLLGAPGAEHGNGKAYYIQGSDSFPKKLVLTQGKFHGTIINGLPCGKTGFSTGVTQQGSRETLLIGSPGYSTAHAEQVGCVSLLMVDVLVGKSSTCAGNSGGSLDEVYLDDLDKKAGYNVVGSTQGARYGTSTDRLNGGDAFVAGAPGCKSDSEPCENDASSNSPLYTPDLGASVALAMVAGKLAAKAVGWVCGLFTSSSESQEIKNKTPVSPTEFENIKTSYQRFINLLKQDEKNNDGLLFHLTDDLEEIEEYTFDNVTPDLLEEWQQELQVYREDFLNECANRLIEPSDKMASRAGVNMHSFYRAKMAPPPALSVGGLQINPR